MPSFCVLVATSLVTSVRTEIPAPTVWLLLSWSRTAAICVRVQRISSTIRRAMFVRVAITVVPLVSRHCRLYVSVVRLRRSVLCTARRVRVTCTTTTRGPTLFASGVTTVVRLATGGRPLSV